MKSLYSLMLDDALVAEIDRLAYLQNTNRSGLVNRILAEYASYVTPEQKIKETFGRIQAVLDGRDSFRLAALPSDTLLSLRSALLYKYNPTVRYSVELYRAASGEVGELRVSLRTQNAALLLYMMRFYELWTRIELSRLGNVAASAQDGKYIRRLFPKEVRHRNGGAVPPAALGELIAAYIRAFDRALKAYFDHPDEPTLALGRIEEIYDGYMRESDVIL